MTKDGGRGGARAPCIHNRYFTSLESLTLLRLLTYHLMTHRIIHITRDFVIDFFSHWLLQSILGLGSRLIDPLSLYF